MSVDGETSRVMKGVQHGACDYLLKPITTKEVKNIWQHVVRKRMHEVSNIECLEDRNGTDHSRDGHNGGDQMFIKKRKDVDKNDEKDSSDSSSTKKARVVWTVELHQKFVKAVNQLGIDSDKIGPKKILDLMNVPWLTRENVASHLQKYRLYLSRIRKEDKMESSFSGMKNQEHSPKGSCGSLSRNSSFGHQKDITSNYYQGNHLSVQPLDSETLDSSMASSKLLPITEHTLPFSIDNSDPDKSRNSQVGLSHSYGSLDISNASFNSSVADRYPWSEEVPNLQFETEIKPRPQLENCFSHSAVPILQQQISPDLLESAPHISPDLLDPTPHISPNLLEPAPHISPGPPVTETNKLGLIDIKNFNPEEGGNNTSKISPIERPLGSFPVSSSDVFGCVLDTKNNNFYQEVDNTKEQPQLEKVLHSLPIHSEGHLVDAQCSEKKKPSSCQGSSKTGQSGVTVSEVELRNQLIGSESAPGLLGEDWMFRWLQCGDVSYKDYGFDCVGFSGCNFPEYDYGCPLPFNVPRLDNDYPFDWVGFPLDQRL